jgi:hypothetical protein
MRWACQIGFVLALLLAVSAWAVPIKPDLQKILKEQPDRPMQFEPARAGWNGPEAPPASQAVRNPVYEAYGPAATARAVRAALIAAATPDPLSIAAVGVLILFWRYSRKQRLQREGANLVAMPTMGATEERRAA